MVVGLTAMGCLGEFAFNLFVTQEWCCLRIFLGFLCCFCWFKWGVVCLFGGLLRDFCALLYWLVV